MLIKEYRILLPLTVDEYRIAQLYMIQVPINPSRRKLSRRGNSITMGKHKGSGKVDLHYIRRK